MKKITTIFVAILFASFALTSCGGNKSDKTATEETATPELKTESAGDCDQFIKDYEAFADSYVIIFKKYKENPTDASILTEYTEIAQKAVVFQEEDSVCMANPKYASKMLEIATKMAKAAL
jgi:hypothetical protein